MEIQLLYFASLRDRLGYESETVNLPAEVTTVGDVRHWLAQRPAPWNEVFTDEGTTLLAALNQTMSKNNQALKANDELAFFPPVTGG